MLTQYENQPALSEAPSDLYDQEPDQVYIAEHSSEYNSDTAALSQLFTAHQVKLSSRFEGTLLSEDEVNGYTTGFARASALIGKVINNTSNLNAVFEPKEVKIMGDDGWPEYVYEWPKPQVMQEISSSRAAGEAGALITQLIHDTISPYEKQEGDGYIEVQSRSPDRAYQTTRYKSPEEGNAGLCADTEDHFVCAGFNTSEKNKTSEVKVGEEVVALQKETGDQTAILIKPIILNGVRIPVGSIMIVEQTESGPLFAFGRLSMFNFTSAEEAIRQMPAISNHKFSGIERYDFHKALSEFNILTNRQNETPFEYAYEIHEKLGIHFGTSLDESRSKLSEAAAQNLQLISDDPELKSVARLLEIQQKQSEKAAVARFNDLQNIKKSDWTHDPKTRYAEIERLAQMKNKMYRMFGPEVVKKVRFILDVNDNLEKII